MRRLMRSTMGKHEHGYNAPAWVIDALAEHVELQNRKIWECAAGDGRMARAIRAHGADVFSTDIAAHDCLDTVFDFLSPGYPDGLGHYDGVVTNSAWGPGNRTAEAFIPAGLARIAQTGGFLALLLPADFDSAVRRMPLFQHPYFVGHIVLTDRPAWFERTDGRPVQPKENCCWALWARPVLRVPAPPIRRYALARAPKAWRRSYNAQDDLAGSIQLGFEFIRERKAYGSPGWVAGGDNKIVPVRAGESVEIHRSGRLEHHCKGRAQWVDLEFVKDYWPEFLSQVEAALAELG
jgi:hypothetical protein